VNLLQGTARTYEDYVVVGSVQLPLGILPFRFLLWWNSTAFFDVLVSNQLGVNVGIQKSIPLTPATAGIYALLSDVLLDWACAKISRRRTLARCQKEPRCALAARSRSFFMSR
jgi:hypothetical protein